MSMYACRSLRLMLGAILHHSSTLFLSQFPGQAQTAPIWLVLLAHLFQGLPVVPF